MADEITNVKRKAVQEIKWLANSLKGLLELADALQEPADLEKETAALRAEISALKVERADLTNLQTEIAVATAKRDSIFAEIEGMRQRLG